jgi:hypothetical protein
MPILKKCSTNTNQQKCPLIANSHRTGAAARWVSLPACPIQSFWLADRTLVALRLGAASVLESDAHAPVGLGRRNQPMDEAHPCRHAGAF